MEKISELAQLFVKYQTYPKDCYNDCSPVRVFQRIFPENHYSKDLKTFLFYQDYKPTQRGADLPWWGKKFFTKQVGFRILIVGQDSLTKDAGSIVLFSHLIPIINTEGGYKEYTDKLKLKKPFPFNSWNKIRTQLINWNINLDFLYITDAAKVYKKGSWKNRDFDRQKSKELLEAEIELCNPDLIILFGALPLHLLDKTKNYASMVENGKAILIKGKKCVVTPFFIGNGPVGNRYGKGFKKRLEIASNLIKKIIKQSMKKVEEIRYSKFFIDHLNNLHGLDYIVYPNENEGKFDKEIDVYAKSEKFPTLNLQVITRERIFKKLGPRLQKEAKAIGQKIVMAPAMDMDIKKWIIESKERKEGKYSPDVKKNLVLLITGDIGPIFNEDYAKKFFDDFKDSGFKGVYSVHLPSDPKTSNYLHNGQIIAIKDIFDRHGETF